MDIVADKEDVLVEIFEDLDPSLPLLLVDFDHTLIQTDKMTEWMFEMMEAYGLPKTKVRNSYSQAKDKNGVYHLYDHIQIICECEKLEAEKLVREIYKGICPTHEVLYPDALPFLEAYTEKVNILLLTLGDPATQRVRIGCLDLLKNVKGIIMSRIPKGDFLTSAVEFEDQGVKLEVISDESFPKMYLIDDNPREFENFPEDELVKGIRLRREGGKYSDLPTPSNSSEISDLVGLQDKLCAIFPY